MQKDFLSDSRWIVVVCLSKGACRNETNEMNYYMRPWSPPSGKPKIELRF